MAGDPPARRGGRVRDIPWRWVWLSTLAAFVVWHTIFDLYVSRGMREYLDGHALHAQGGGPEVTIHGVMDAAVRRGVGWGLAGAAVALAAAAGLRWALRRRR